MPCLAKPDRLRPGLAAKQYHRVRDLLRVLRNVSPDPATDRPLDTEANSQALCDSKESPPGPGSLSRDFSLYFPFKRTPVAVEDVPRTLA